MVLHNISVPSNQIPSYDGYLFANGQRGSMSDRRQNKKDTNTHTHTQVQQAHTRTDVNINIWTHNTKLKKKMKMQFQYFEVAQLYTTHAIYNCSKMQ